MMDANQVWEVEEAIANMERLAEFDPWWIEEPTSPDDVLGHARIARAVAHRRCHGRALPEPRRLQASCSQAPSASARSTPAASEA